MFMLLGQSMSLQITWGGQQAAAGPTWGTGQEINAKTRLRSARVNNSAITTDVSTLADLIEQVIVKRKKARVELELLVPSTGPIGVDNAGTPRIGEFCKVEIKSLASMAGWRTWTGVVTEQNEEFPDGEQVEHITIEIGAAGIAYDGGKFHEAA